jgi:hypothetical protein
MQANRYEQQPQYVMYAGLVFQPLEKPLMASVVPGSLRTRYFFQYFTTDELYREKPQPVVLTNVLPDEINTWLREFSGQIVEEINGLKISRLKDVADGFQKETGSDFHIIRLSGEGRPLVLNRKEAAAAQPRLLEKYGVGASAYIE